MHFHYTGNEEPYQVYFEKNRLSYDYPIYIGKAVPRGWRQSRVSDNKTNQSYELHSRIREHSNNIDKVQGIELKDFSCRFVIFEENGSDMIGAIEAALIKINMED